MPYSDIQRRQHIFELQTYLHAISLMDNKIPLVIPDGVYGQETSIAVMAFQREHRLKDTGKTDPETWDMIVKVYRSYLDAEPIAYSAFPSAGYTAVTGDSGQLVYIIQAMLHSVGTCYDNTPNVTVCGNFNEVTCEAVKRFQKWSGLPENGKVDSGTWNMLVRCCEHINMTVFSV